MERRHLRHMSYTGERPFGRALDRRVFADAAVSEETRKPNRSEDPVARMRPQIGLTDPMAVPLVQHAPDVARSTVIDGRDRASGRSGSR